jgi:AAA family ATP:ADP antiporter
MLTNVIRYLWGDLSDKEIKKFGILSAIITLILGNYWMLRSLKNPVFNDLVGLEYQPFAKMGSLFVVAFIILIYSKLVDILSKKRLFDVVCVFYGVMFALIAMSAMHPEYFFEDTSLLSIIPIHGNVMGWICYFTFESSSLMIILFWSFVASVTKPESAKKGYGMIITCTQLGTILGSVIVAKCSTIWGAPAIIALGAFTTFLVPVLIRVYLSSIPSEEGVVKDTKEKKPKTGFLEGLKLIGTKPYVIGILVVSTVYEIVATILEFQMNMIAKDIYISRDLYASFTGTYGVSINLLALSFALTGTSFFMRRFGLRFCLLAYPALVGTVLTLLFIFKSIGYSELSLMWALFVSMVLIKGFSYALNNPTKEVMYIPTTQDIRFKAKSWIESFGGRSAKGTGAVVTASFAQNLGALLTYGTVISLGIVGVWIVAANLLGKKFNRLQEKNQTIS